MLSDDLMLAIASEISRWFELAGITAIVLGALLSVANAAFRWTSWEHPGGGSPTDDRTAIFRKSLGRSILIGLELLVAGDIIRTVAVAPSLENLLVLGGIVLIRTFLSISLEVEIEGKWPWRRADPGD
ncbi:MAG: DUF1622 domain-containing protein [Croceibacterium sp.]